MHSNAQAHAPRSYPTRTAKRLRWLTPLGLLLLAAPAISQSPVRRGCPQFARVPGYGACSNIGGSNCGFCTYRCNDETVVRWNVCGK